MGTLVCATVGADVDFCGTMPCSITLFRSAVAGMLGQGLYRSCFKHAGRGSVWTQACYVIARVDCDDSTLV